MITEKERQERKAKKHKLVITLDENELTFLNATISNTIEGLKARKLTPEGYMFVDELESLQLKFRVKK